MQNSLCFHPERIPVDWEGAPNVIVAVCDGEPLVLIVSEDTRNLFESAQKKLEMSHVALANALRERVCQGGGQFHENAIVYALQRETSS